MTPGLIDLHTDVYSDATIFGVEADQLWPRTGVTTVIDAGSAGCANFRGLKRYVIVRSQTRILAFLHLSAIGLTWTVGEVRLEECIQPIEAARVVTENPDVLLGIKIRLGTGLAGNRDFSSLLKQAVVAPELVSYQTGLIHLMESGLSGVDAETDQESCRLQMSR